MPKQIRYLHFDMECRPLSWYGGEWVTKEPTAFSAAWSDRPDKLYTWLLRHSSTDEGFNEQMYRMLDLWNKLTAGDLVVVSGHWVRGFDLPLLNATSFRVSGGPIDDVMASDTKSDLVTLGGLSKSQENLGSLLKLEHEKISMNTGKWESANRLTTAGIEESRKRVEGDVKQHIEMRKRLLPYLGPPRIWTAGSSGKAGGYVG